MAAVPSADLCSSLPQELYVNHIFVELEDSDLLRISQVCHFFLFSASDNSLWRRRFQKKYVLPTIVAIPPSFSWKNEYFRVKRAFASLSPRASPAEKFQTFWKFGCIHTKQVKDDSFHLNRIMSGEYVEHNFRKESSQVIASVMQAIYCGELGEALTLYTAYKTTLIKGDLLHGWWLGHLLQALTRAEGRTVQMDPKDLIRLPNSSDKRSLIFRDTLEGGVLAWFRQGNNKFGMLALDCYIQLSNSLDKENIQIKENAALFIKRLFLLISEKECPHSFWELLGKCISRFDIPQTEHEIEAYSKSLDIEKATYTQKRHVKGLIGALVRNLQNRKESSAIEFERACLPILHINLHGPEGFSHSDIIDIALIVREYKIDKVYAFTLKLLEPILSNDSLSKKKLEQLYYSMMPLLMEKNRSIKAIHLWGLLGRMTFPSQEEKGIIKDLICGQSYFDLGYQILNKSPKARIELMKFAGSSPYVDCGVAYVFALEGKFPAAYKTIITVAPDVSPDALYWAKELGRNELEIAIAYSHSIKTTGALEDYFNELFDYYPDQPFLLYFFLAKRMVALDEVGRGLEILELALEYQSEDEEARKLEAEWRLIFHSRNNAEALDTLATAKVS